jgi:hypothetical protein
MSKFEEMCKAFTDARNTWTAYRDRCFQHISTLSTGFVKYCEIPQGRFAFVPDKDSEADKQYSPHDAIQFDSDGYWHLGWRIGLFESPNSFPQRQVVVRFALKESESGKVMVKRGWEQEAHELDLNNESQCREFYDSITDRIKEYYGRNPQDFGGDESRSNKMGFQVL